MHQIRLRLGLCHRPRWGSLQSSPVPRLDLRSLLLRKWRRWDRGRKEKERANGEGKERGKGRENAGEGGRHSLTRPLA